MIQSDIINTLMHTEKSTVGEANGKYLFWVKIKATKLHIKKAIENLYKVNVKKVNTSVMPGKSKRVRHQLGYTPDWKKAIITLKEGQKIEIK
ncbi:MAG: 50S ribosomal protein L23 [Candidatus Omnitrophota bacterium]